MSDVTITIPPSTTPTVISVSITVGPSTAPPVVTPPIVIPPTVTPAKMAIGTNVPSNDPTSGVAAWCDVTHQMTGWYSVSGQITYDANGYPAAITVGGQAAAWTYLYGYPSGSYKLAWKGSQNGLTIQGKSFTPVSDGGGGWTATVQFNNGDRVEFRTPGGISAVSLLSPDAKAGQVFRDAYLALLKPYKVCRLMPMQRVNGVKGILRTNWAQRTLPTSWDQTTNEVAIELCAELCKESGTIPWVCLPYGAPDDYIAGVAKAFAGFPLVYLEYSNELWNNVGPGGAYQGYQIRADAVKLGKYGTDLNQAGARYHADLLNHVGSVVQGIITSHNYKLVFSGQATWNQWANDGLTWLKPGQVDCLAVAPYFEPNNGDPVATVPQILADCQKWIDTILSPGVADNAAVAKKYGCDFLAYEGGQSLAPTVNLGGPGFIAIQPDTPARLAAFNADPATVAQNDAGMGTLYDNLFSMCTGKGMSLFCNFMVVSNWGSSGYWGLRQVSSDPENVRTQAISRAISAVNA